MLPGNTQRVPLETVSLRQDNTDRITLLITALAIKNIRRSQGTEVEPSGCYRQVSTCAISDPPVPALQTLDGQTLLQQHREP